MLLPQRILESPLETEFPLDTELIIKFVPVRLWRELFYLYGAFIYFFRAMCYYHIIISKGDDEMIFTPFDMASYPRREVFMYFSKMVPTGYSITVNVDVTKLRSTTREQGIKFSPFICGL